jgi:hypothetical protein
MTSLRKRLKLIKHKMIILQYLKNFKYFKMRMGKYQKDKKYQHESVPNGQTWKNLSSLVNNTSIGL